jgi:hypothetical protein
MTHPKLLTAAAILSALVLAPALAPHPAQARAHRHVRFHGLPYHISFYHNYGPGPLPGTFAYYDGPSTNHCYRGAATYLGQDHRGHPCS